MNRISCAKMRIENKIYCLSPNDENGVDHFNGGFVGFDNVNWNSCIMKKHVVNIFIIIVSVISFYSYLFNATGYVSRKSSKIRRIPRRYVNAD